MSGELKKSDSTWYGTNAQERLLELERSVNSDIGGGERNTSIQNGKSYEIIENEQEASNNTRDNCCFVQAEPCAWLDFLTAVVFTGYCVFIVWLLAHTRENLYYHLLNILVFSFIVIWSIFPWCYTRGMAIFSRQLRLIGVVAVLMTTFTMLTRTAFYQLTSSKDVTIGKNFVVVSLKACIAVFLWAMLAQKRLSLIAIKADKQLIVQVILDSVDIFSLAETLCMSHSSDSAVGKMEPVIQEGTPLEMTIQTFCTLAFVVLWIQVAALGTALDHLAGILQQDPDRVSTTKSVYNIIFQSLSLAFHNIPFLAIRIFVWVQFKVYDIGFIAKNVMAIIFGIAELRYSVILGYNP